MNGPGFLRKVVDPRRWPSLLVFFAVLVLMLIISGPIASLGIHYMGNKAAIEAARQAALPWLFLWRWACYAVLITGWLRTWKPRVLRRLNEDTDGGTEAREGLRRLERLAIGIMACIEVFNLLSWMEAR